jgi:hypothetical protein
MSETEYSTFNVDAYYPDDDINGEVSDTNTYIIEEQSPIVLPELNVDAPLPEQDLVETKITKPPDYPYSYPAYVAPKQHVLFWARYSSDIRWCVYFIIVLILIIVIIYVLKICIDGLIKMSKKSLMK